MTDYARSRDWGIYGIGIGVPSVVDNGVVLFANNLPELDNQQLDLALAEFNHRYSSTTTQTLWGWAR